MNFLCTENFHDGVMDARRTLPLFPTVDHGTCEITSSKLKIGLSELVEYHLSRTSSQRDIWRNEHD